MTCGSLWTEERNAELKELWVQGLSAWQIGLVLGISRNAVMGKVYRMKLEKRAPTGPNGGRQRKPGYGVDGTGIALPHNHTLRKRKPYIRRTPNPQQFIRETGELIEQPHEVLAPPVSLMDLESHHCRWPIDGSPTVYCGVQRIDGVSYCLTHARIAYQRPPTWSDAQRAKAAIRARRRTNERLAGAA